MSFLFGINAFLPLNVGNQVMHFMAEDFSGKGWAETWSPVFNGITAVSLLVMLFCIELLPAYKYALAACLPVAVCSIGQMLAAVLDGDVGARFSAAMAFSVCLAIFGAGVFQSSSANVCAGLGGKLFEFWSTGLGFAGVLVFLVDLAMVNIAGKRASVITLFLVMAVFYLISFAALLQVRRVQKERVQSAPLVVEMEGNTDPDAEDDPNSFAGVAETPGGAAAKLQSIWEGFKIHSLHILAIFLVASGSFIVFPEVVLSWKPGGGMDKESFETVILGLFNCFDFLGRFITHIEAVSNRLRVGPRSIWVVLLVRYGLIGFIIAVYKLDNTGLGSFPLKVVLMILLGLSNGILTNLVLSWMVRDGTPSSRPVGGRCIPLFGVTGFFVGSTLANFIVR
jgi:hypothetical protein